MDALPILKKVVQAYDDALAQIVNEVGHKDIRYKRLRCERDTLNELWHDLKAKGA